ncbi:DUF5330 domain-containing protein [Aureimonas sp. N4]|uniref:DUF5330 domain-containing protein n=1 Tax=Aureimonas sp. N4 TaxID=1638165 RepID=UPI0007839AD3|nr:DUF5330 domain-containing protein [Aureimonas sp. N4]
MRFLIKIAFLIGLIALFLPGHRDKDGASDPGLSPVVLLYGVQQAFSDLGGFCDRSPAACASARDAASFVVARVQEGAVIGYGLIREKMAGEKPAQPAPNDPPVPPRAYTPPGTARPNASITTGSVAPGAPAALSFAAPERPAPTPIAIRPALQTPAPNATAARPLPQPYRKPVPADAPAAAKAPESKTPAMSQAAKTAEVAPPIPDRVPGSPKPFRMPAMAGGADEPLHPVPQAILPPERAPLPRFAPRA